MFNPYDEHNHAGLLYGMRASPLLGLAGPSDRAGTGNRAAGNRAAGNRAGTRRVGGQSNAQAVAALPQATKQALAKLCGYADVAKWEEGFVAYLDKPFDPPNSDYTKDAKALFVGACAYAADDPTVNAYFDALVPALDAKAAAITTGNAAKVDESGAANQQKIIDAATKFVAEQQDILKQSSDKLHSAMMNFVDWVQQSMKSIFDDPALFPGNTPWTPWMIQQALYGKLPFYYDEDTPVVDPNKITQGSYPQFEAGPLPSIVTSTLKGSLTYEDQEDGLYNEYNFSSGPALAEIPPAFVQVPNGKAWIEVINGKAYIAVAFPKFYWRYAGLGSTVPTRLRYDGISRSAAPGGFCATQSWNLGVVQHATNMQATQKKISEQQYAITLATQEKNKLLASKNIKDAKSAAEKFESLLAEANAIKDQLSKGFLLGYVESITKQLLAAAELTAMTDSREAIQGKIDELKTQADTLTANAAKLIEDARNEKDPEKRARMRSEAERRLSRATGIARRRLDLIERDGELGKRRAGRVETIKKEAQRSSIPIPTGAKVEVGGKTVTLTPESASNVAVPPASKLGKKIKKVTESVNKDAAAIVPLNQHSEQQKKANEAMRETIIVLAEKLPEKYKPNLPPPPPPKEEGGSGLGLIVAGLVAFAALRNKN